MEDAGDPVAQAIQQRCTPSPRWCCAALAATAATASWRRVVWQRPGCRRRARSRWRTALGVEIGIGLAQANGAVGQFAEAPPFEAHMHIEDFGDLALRYPVALRRHRADVLADPTWNYLVLAVAASFQGWSWRVSLRNSTGIGATVKACGALRSATWTCSGGGSRDRANDSSCDECQSRGDELMPANKVGHGATPIGRPT